MEEAFLKKLSDYLRKGAKLTSENCPMCNSPLVKINDQYFCVKCEREVIFASSKEEYVDMSMKIALTSLKEFIANRITVLREELSKNPDDLTLLNVINQYLEITERIDRLLGRKGK